MSNIDNEKMYSTINEQLYARHWGIRAEGSSPGNRPRFYVMDFRGLALATGIVRYKYRDSEMQIFYRGQEQDWELRPSLYRECNNKDTLKKLNQWHERALECIKPFFDSQGCNDDDNDNDKEREALAQHYGFPTKYLDVVDHIQTALWFAYNQGESNGGSASRHDESVGYIQVIAVPKTANIIDLRRKPSEWLRPHLQQGLCVSLENPDKELGKLSKYLVLTFIINRENLRRWSNYDNIPRDYFFPSEQLDRGLIYWKKAEKQLKSENLFDCEGNINLAGF